MSRNIEISIIIPLYNRANGIQRLLQKLSIQSFDMNHVEIIVSDDKSTDNSVDIVKSFANQLPNLTILKSKVNSGGASVPRNKALDIAKGKWLLFIDSDDYITEHTLTDAVATANKSQDDMVCLPYFRA
ncbi:glycosyltransferase family 2 protein, partial [Staphylococcus gallinarum]